MRNHKTTLVLVLLALSAITITTKGKFINETRAYTQGRNATANQQRTDEEKAEQRNDFEAQFPSVDYDAPNSELNDPEKRAKRKVKNNHYDKYSFGISDPTPRVNETSVETEWSLHVSPLPVEESELVLVGEVLKAEAHLSNNKKGIYSEFTIRVDDVVKPQGTAEIALGSMIAIERLGGTVKYAAGNKRIVRIEGQGMPRINRRYVFFLNTTEHGQGFRLLTGYELHSGKIIPLDISTRMNAYKGMAEEAFLNQIRDVLAKSLQKVIQ